MDTRVAAIGDQLKNAVNKLKEAWIGLERTHKLRIIIIAAALIALAVGLTVFMNARSNQYVVLYKDLPREESVEGLSALTAAEANINARLNPDTGELEVVAGQKNKAMGILAQNGIPKESLDYSVFSEASGLTMTDFEKHQYLVYQEQNRLQDIIKTFDGVKNAYVNLKIEEDSNRVWKAGTSKNTASVKVDLEPGAVLTAGQISGIRYLVGPSSGIDPGEVSVIDSSGTVLAASGDSYDADYASTQQFLQRMGFEQDVEDRMYDKTANILSLAYPNSDDYRISITAKLNWDDMITESREYIPYDDTNAGVVESEDINAAMGVNDYASGVVGETDNTDIPTYVDQNGDGTADLVDFTRSRQYLVSYITRQIEKDGATLDEASIAVVIKGTINNDMRQMLRESIASATNVPIESISVQSFIETVLTPTETDSTGTIFGIPILYLYIAAAAIIGLIIALIIVMILRKKASRKRLEAEAAALAAEEEEALRIQQEIEDRKQQLKDQAMAGQSEDIIVNEVREFARSNPEITANLLRNWLKEGE